MLLFGTSSNLIESSDGSAPQRLKLICPDPNDPANYGVSVTPDGGTASSQAGTNHNLAVFTIQNTGICNDNYGFTPYATGPITVVSQSKSSATVNTRLSTTDTVIYNVGSVGSGTLTLQAGSS